jgi:hypothetical protein
MGVRFYGMLLFESLGKYQFVIVLWVFFGLHILKSEQLKDIVVELAL